MFRFDNTVVGMPAKRFWPLSVVLLVFILNGCAATGVDQPPEEDETTGVESDPENGEVAADSDGMFVQDNVEVSRSVSGSISPLFTARSFAAPGEFPPADYAAYGILAFTQRPTASTFDRFVKICLAYSAAFPLSNELPDVSTDMQAVTVWPVTSEAVIESLNAVSDEIEACEIAVRGYGLAPAQDALRAAKIGLQGKTLRGEPINLSSLDRGPYLLAWAPGNMKGESDTLILGMDLSLVETEDVAAAAFRLWIGDIQSSPELWSRGWNVQRVRFRLRQWIEKTGEDLARLFFVSDS